MPLRLYFLLCIHQHGSAGSEAQTHGGLSASQVEAFKASEAIVLHYYCYYESYPHTMVCSYF